VRFEADRKKLRKNFKNLRKQRRHSVMISVWNVCLINVQRLYSRQENWVFLISPTGSTILFNIFISLLYMFRASMCPSSRENYCIYATLVFCHFLDGAWSAGWIETPKRVTKYQCRIDKAILSWWWAHGCPKHIEKRNKYIKQNCPPSWSK